MCAGCKRRRVGRGQGKWVGSGVGRGVDGKGWGQRTRRNAKQPNPYGHIILQRVRTDHSSRPSRWAPRPTGRTQRKDRCVLNVQTAQADRNGWADCVDNMVIRHDGCVPIQLVTLRIHRCTEGVVDTYASKMVRDAPVIVGGVQGIPVAHILGWPKLGVCLVL